MDGLRTSRSIGRGVGVMIAAWVGSACLGAATFTPLSSLAGGDVYAVTTWDPDGGGPLSAQIVAGGGFIKAGGVSANRIARWDGSAWQPLGAGMNFPVRSLATWDPDGGGPLPAQLVAGGDFTTAGGVSANRIARWDGTAWQPLGTGMSSFVQSLTTWDPDGGGPLSAQLVAGGGFVTAGGVTVNRIARWDGAAWQPLGTGMSGVVQSLTTWDPDGGGPLSAQLVAGGDFATAGGVSANRIARWDGTVWQPLGTGMGGVVQSLTTWDPDGGGPLSAQPVAGGDFTTAGGVSANRIARWDGTAWQPLGTGMNFPVRALTTWDPDGGGPLSAQPVAGGDFTTAGGVSANRIARWNGSAWQTFGIGMSGDVFAFGFGVSGNGAVIVGQSTGTSIGQAVSWTGSGFTVGALGTIDGLLWSTASAASGDGAVIIGTAGNGSLANGQSAFRRTGGVNTALGDLPGGTTLSEAWGISGNGNVIVGRSVSANGYEAFRWTSGGGMAGIGDLAGGEFASQARACSNDGAVIVGWGTSANGTEAFRWTQAGGMVGLGDLPGGLFASFAYDCSSDGSVVVGYSRGVQGDEAFRWTNGVMVGLGDLSGGGFGSVASACSANGNVIVGASIAGDSCEAFVWTPGRGMRRLQDVLVTDFGLNLNGWTLLNATGVSDDGLTIVGYGVNPTDQYQAFVVKLTAALPVTVPVVADANGDGRVDNADLSILLAQYNRVVETGSGADFNEDGRVDGADLSLLLSGYGAS